ncbi:MAG: hypothetical protein K0S23_364 [Fluviicola sp.]|jgi:hypothetical protein|uniref:hypothetical protein n=1 Tax=Fluviicola sp. TaxID=1917219 RepID=UPI00260E8BF7|nr:hypothetical protein [Fluviicola sp.]MDF3026057.1 hypothetical protein [Fluviicola sp.]
MKFRLLIFCFFTLLSLSAQDTSKITEIDRLVLEINSLTLPPKTDTLKNIRPNLEIVTLVSFISANGELYKCIYNVTADISEQGLTKRSIGITNYYYHKNETIKIERYILDEGIENRSVWYYWEGKPIYNTGKSADSEVMANDLLNASREIRKKVIGSEIKK